MSASETNEEHPGEHQTDQCQLHIGVLELVRFPSTCPKGSTSSVSPHKSRVRPSERERALLKRLFLALQATEG